LFKKGYVPLNLCLLLHHKILASAINRKNATETTIHIQILSPDFTGKLKKKNQ